MIKVNKLRKGDLVKVLLNRVVEINSIVECFGNYYQIQFKGCEDFNTFHGEQKMELFAARII